MFPLLLCVLSVLQEFKGKLQFVAESGLQIVEAQTMTETLANLNRIIDETRTVTGVASPCPPTMLGQLYNGVDRAVLKLDRLLTQWETTYTGMPLPIKVRDNWEQLKNHQYQQALDDDFHRNIQQIMAEGKGNKRKPPM